MANDWLLNGNLAALFRCAYEKTTLQKPMGLTPFLFSIFPVTQVVPILAFLDFHIPGNKIIYLEQKRFPQFIRLVLTIDS